MTVGVIYLGNKAYVGVNLADIHWGVMKPQELYEQLKKTVLKQLEDMAVLDFIIIEGDYYDTKISLNSDHAKYSLQFMSRLLEIAHDKGAKVRIIKGTESHDNKQLEALEVFTRNNKYDFRIISTVEEEWLFDDMHVLYIPEEYVTDKDEYYKEYFTQEYDMIFGHGLISEVAFVAAKQESEVTMSKAPIFNSEQLLNICKGPIFFGHIHIPQIVKDRFFYVGSTSRWCFGEEEDKGFYLVTYSPDNSKFLAEFIVNKYAKKYDTVVIDYNSSFFKDDDKSNVDYLVKLVDGLLIDNLRLIVNIPEDYPNALLLSQMINEMFSKYSNIKVLINNNSKMRQKKETEEKINLLLEKYGFIFSKTMCPEEKISEYIRIKYNKNIPVDKIRYYLYQQILRGEAS
jgi:hypothetical protein